MNFLGVFLILLYITSNSNVQGQSIFIGHGSSSHYFALRMSPNYWDWGMNNCHSGYLMPGSIPSELDRIITTFLNTSTQIGDENRFLWLAATDHKQEGTFQWLWNSEEVNVGSWVPGMPSLNRTANCLAINRHGQFMEAPCFNYGDSYFVLCEAPRFYQGKPPNPATQKIEKTSTKLKTRVQTVQPQQALLALTVIGQVGNRLYFTDEGLMSWTESLDLCHSSGMRLATPEEPEQFNFLRDYAIRRAQEGEPYPIYYLGGTDRLSLSCLKSNTEFYWFYSGNTITNQTTLSGNSGYYQCVFITPTGMTNSACVIGGGAFCHPICEINI